MLDGCLLLTGGEVKYTVDSVLNKWPPTALLLRRVFHSAPCVLIIIQYALDEARYYGIHIYTTTWGPVGGTCPQDCCILCTFTFRKSFLFSLEAS